MELKQLENIIRRIVREENQLHEEKMIKLLNKVVAEHKKDAKAVVLEIKKNTRSIVKNESTEILREVALAALKNNAGGMQYQEQIVENTIRMPKSSKDALANITGINNMIGANQTPAPIVSDPSSNLSSLLMSTEPLPSSELSTGGVW